MRRIRANLVRAGGDNIGRGLRPEQQTLPKKGEDIVTIFGRGLSVEEQTLPNRDGLHQGHAVRYALHANSQGVFHPFFGRGLSVEEQTRPKGGYPCSALIGISAWNPLTIVGPEMMVEIQAVATTSRRRRRLRQRDGLLTSAPPAGFLQMPRFIFGRGLKGEQPTLPRNGSKSVAAQLPG